MSLAKTIERLNERIANGELYEAHQAVRTVVARYVRRKEYSEAVGTLYVSAQQLAAAGEYASAADLLQYMLQVYTTAKATPTKANKARAVQILVQIDVASPAFAGCVQAVARWSNNADEVLRAAGYLYARSGKFFEAESWLLRGGKSCALLLAKLHSAIKADPNRGVLGFLSVGSVLGASVYLTEVKKINGDASSDELVKLDQLVLTCRTRSSNLFAQYLRLQQPPQTFAPSFRAIQQAFFA